MGERTLTKTYPTFTFGITYAMPVAKKLVSETSPQIWNFADAYWSITLHMSMFFGFNGHTNTDPRVVVKGFINLPGGYSPEQVVEYILELEPILLKRFPGSTAESKEELLKNASETYSHVQKYHLEELVCELFPEK